MLDIKEHLNVFNYVNFKIKRTKYCSTSISSTTTHYFHCKIV